MDGGNKGDGGWEEKLAKTSSSIERARTLQPANEGRENVLPAAPLHATFGIIQEDREGFLPSLPEFLGQLMMQY